MSIKSIITTLIVSFVIFSVLVIGCNILIKIQTDGINEQWREYEAGTTRKSTLLNDIRGAIGLGGVVHQFQSFVVHNDRVLLVNIARELWNATVALTAYGSLETSNVEDESLKKFSATLLQYKDNMVIAEQLLAKNTPIREVFRSISIDEERALEGLKALDSEIKSIQGTSSRKLDETVNTVDKTILISSAGTVFLILALAAFITITMRNLLRSLGGEPARIINIVKRIADGDLTEDLALNSGENRGVYLAMQQMQINLKQQIEADSAAA